MKGFELEKCTDKKLAILKAAEKLFAQNGFYGTEVEQIAKTAGMAKGTVYNYFTNKEEILISIIESGIDELEQIMETGIEKSLGVVDKIKSGIRIICQSSGEKPASFQDYGGRAYTV